MERCPIDREGQSCLRMSGLQEVVSSRSCVYGLLRREEKSCCTTSLWKLAMVLVEDGYDERNMIAKRCFPTLVVNSRLCENDVNGRQIY
jgi:hypothetical protein